jgi:hypothetical protein
MVVEEMQNRGETEEEINKVTEGNQRGTDKSLYALSRVLGIPIRLVHMRPMPGQEVIEIVGEGEYEETVTIVVRPSHFNGTRRKTVHKGQKHRTDTEWDTDESDFEEDDVEEDQPDEDGDPSTPVASTSMKEAAVVDVLRDWVTSTGTKRAYEYGSLRRARWIIRYNEQKVGAVAPAQFTVCELGRRLMTTSDSSRLAQTKETASGAVHSGMEG